MMPTLLLASKSRSRRELLDSCRIPYCLVEQEADESQHPDLGLLDLVQYLAELKMGQVVLPANLSVVPGKIYCWVLTADTLGVNSLGEICRKPVDRADAIRMLQQFRQGATTATGYCVDRRIWQVASKTWEVDQRIVEVASASYTFNVPDLAIDRYLDHAISGVSFLDISGAVEVEHYGQQFLGDIQGSYTAIVGLPMYEVRMALEQLGFYDS